VNTRARREQVAVGGLLFVLSALSPLLDSGRLWPLTLVGAAIGGLLFRGAIADESVAGPTAALITTAVPGIWVTDRLAVGALASVTIAIALGEHLSSLRVMRYATPGTAPEPIATVGTLQHGGVAAVAIVLALSATLLPETRVWSATALIALVVLAAALHRRRGTIAAAGLPPPAPPG
jgi:hypothetical protein